MTGIRSKGAILALIAAMSWVAAAAAQEPGWRDAQGQVLADTDARKVVDGFGAWLIATSKYEEAGVTRAATDALATALANETHVVRRGDIVLPQVFLLSLRDDGFGTANVTCALRFTRPDGSEEKSYAMRCLEAANGGDTNLRQARLPVEFFADVGDPAGTWKIEVVVHDQERLTTIALSTPFELADTN